MLDRLENAEVDGGCREFGLSGVKGVGRPLVILHTLIVLGYSFRQPHSARGSLGKESTHWNGREVNRWISCDWELMNVRGSLMEIVVRDPQKELGTNLQKETQVFMDCQIVVIISIPEMYC